jgi:hypothetical protein
VDASIFSAIIQPTQISDTTDECVFREMGELVGCLCLHFARYNSCRIHKSLRVTPAMESKLTDHVWNLAELLA